MLSISSELTSLADYLIYCLLLDAEYALTLDEQNDLQTVCLVPKLLLSDCIQSHQTDAKKNSNWTHWTE